MLRCVRIGRRCVPLSLRGGLPAPAYDWTAAHCRGSRWSRLYGTTSSRGANLEDILLKIPSPVADTVPGADKEESSSVSNTESDRLPKYESAYYQRVRNHSQLLSIVDPISNASKAFHPAIIRAYKGYKSYLSISKKVSNQHHHSILTGVFRTTESALLYMNNRMHKFHKFDKPIEGASRYSTSLLLDLFQVSSDALNIEELHFICSSVLILKPKNKHLWDELDKYMLKQIQSDIYKTYDLLILGYCFLYAKEEIFYLKSIKFVSLDYIINKILSDISSISSNEKNLFEYADTGEVQLNYVGENVVYDSRSIENLSLFLSILASSTAYDKQTSSNMNTNHGLNIIDSKQPSVYTNNTVVSRVICNYTMTVLSNRGAPVKILTLKPVWHSLARMNLPDYYIVNKLIFDLVSVSLITDPLQLVHQESAMVSLLQAMLKLKHKNLSIIHSIYKEISNYNLMKSKYGFVLYNLFIEIGQDDLASSLLDKIMMDVQNSTARIGIFNINRFNVIQLNDISKSNIYNNLHSKTSQYSYSDLLVALHCFSRDSSRLQYRLFCVIEESILNALANLKLVDILGLYCSYASVGRKYPDMLRAIDEIIHNQINSFDYIQLVRLVWCSARLNHYPIYLDKAIEVLFGMIPHIIYIKGHSSVTQLLWSLAVLERLSIDRFVQLEKCIIVSTSEDVPQMSKQLSQAILEIKLTMKSNPSSYTEIQRLQVECMLEKWKHLSLGMKSIQTSSSYYHADVAMVLREMRIVHKNEKELEHGLTVDIFIGDELPRRRISSRLQGLVIEVDGPVHFESYLREPLGPTVMKRRHLRTLGYEVLSISCTDYDLDSTLESKIAYMKRLLNRSVYLAER